jgi:hypothetical protein
VLARTPRIVLSFLSISLWLGLLLLGVVPAPAAHVLLLTSLVLFPWRELR